MSHSKIIQVAIAVGNVVFALGCYKLSEFAYFKYKMFKKESQRLKNGGSTSYSNLIEAFNNSNQSVDVVALDQLSFSGVSTPIDEQTISSQIDDSKYILVRVVTQELSQQKTVTRWISKFNLTDGSNQVGVKVTDINLFSARLYKQINNTIKQEKPTGIKASLKNAFSLNIKISESGIAFGSNLYVFGAFIKNKLGQIECIKPEFICDATQAQSQTQLQSYLYLILLGIFGTVTVGSLAFLGFYIADQRKAQQQQQLQH